MAEHKKVRVWGVSVSLRAAGQWRRCNKNAAKLSPWLYQWWWHDTGAPDNDYETVKRMMTMTAQQHALKT